MTKIFKDTIYFFAGTILPAAVSFVSLPIMSRYFLPTEYGQNALIDTSYSYIYTILFGFITSIIWRFYNQYKQEHKLDEFWSCILLLIKVSWIAVLFGMAIVAILPIDSYLKKLILLKGLSILIGSYVAIFSIILRMEGDALIFNIIQCYNSLAGFLLLLFLTKIMHMRNISMYLSSLVVSIPVLVFFLIRNRNIEIKKMELSKKIEHLKPFFSYGGIALLTTFLQVILDSSDRFMIKYFLDYNSTGIYDKLYSISNRILDIFVAVFMNLFSPYIHKALSKNEEKRLYKQLLPVFCGIFFPLLMYYSIFSETICSILLSKEYLEYYFLIPIISFGYVFISFSSFGELIIKYSNKFHRVAIGFVTALVFNFILNFWLIPRIGILGAAIGTASAYLILLIYFFINARLCSVHYFLYGKLKENLFYLIPTLECILYFCFLKSGYQFGVIKSVLIAILFAISYYLPYCYYFLFKNREFTNLFEKDKLE